MTKKAYLYNRVSKKSQATEGQGLKRQRLLAEEFLTQHPDYSVCDIYEDIGKSAYYSENLSKDAGLGGFIEAAEKGHIEQDSLLVIESIDRLSRLGIKQGSTIINRLFDCRIDIGVVKFNTIYRWKDDNDLANSIQIISGLYLGRLESEQKSQRIKKTFDTKLEMARKGEIKFRPRVHPSWIQLNKKKNQYSLIPEKAVIVQLIFELRLTEGIGVNSIIKHLNDQEVQPISGRASWTYNGVNNLLKNRSVIGEYQPTEKVLKSGKSTSNPKGSPITDYYPAAVSAEVFNDVQKIFAQSSHQAKRQGRKAGYKNLFRHTTFCLLCGSSMTYKENHLMCSKPSKECKNSNVRYANVESTLTNFFQSDEIDLAQQKFDFSNESSREKFNALLIAKVDYINFFDDYILIKFKGSSLEHIRHANYSTIRSLRKITETETLSNIDKLKSSCQKYGLNDTEAPNVTRSFRLEQSAITFINELKTQEDIHVARFIYKRQAEESLTRKQTTRLLNKAKIKLSLEEHNELQAELKNG